MGSYNVRVYKSEEDLSDFEKMNRGWKVTGELLEEKFPDGSGTTYVVMTGPFTNTYMCRDCGDHYIIARWSRWDRIDKGTLKITVGVDDR